MMIFQRNERNEKEGSQELGDCLGYSYVLYFALLESQRISHCATEKKRLFASLD